MCDINIDDYIEIISPCETTGMHGIIKKIFYSYNNTKYVCVHIEEINETRSYNMRSVKLINRKDRNVMNYLMENCREIVGVNFLNGYDTKKEYYFASYESNIKIDDLVVVNTSDNFSIAKVVNIYDKKDIKRNVTKEIVTIIDTNAFNTRQQLKKKCIELKQKMDQKVRELQNMAIYEVLVEKDNDLAEMLKEYKLFCN